MRLLLLLALSINIVMAQNNPIEPETTTQQTYLTDSSITGNYYLAINELVRDVRIDTPVKGKFYFHFFIAQTPIEGKMSVLAYSELDGVATFNQNKTATYVSPDNKCALTFYFRSMQLFVEQAGSCDMPRELGYETTGNYNQLESF